MKGIKYIFLDIDNTLLDFDICTKEGIGSIMQRHGLGEFTEERQRVFHEENHKLWSAIERGEITIDYLRNVRFCIVFERLGIDFDGVLFEEEFRKYIFDNISEVEGARGLLENLSKKYILCSASNGPYKQQVHRLEKSGFNQYLTYNFISEDLGVQKPNPDFFNRAMDRMNMHDVDKCIMVGDSISSDISGGKSVGMKTILFNKHHKSFEKDAADYIFDSLKEIEDFLMEEDHD